MSKNRMISNELMMALIKYCVYHIYITPVKYGV